ncbi:hypothetical protein AAG747_10935 [Rapidithrix thailandica]|uniref:Uncharacterized protein n=1 Tax=Rapidithrix thailandica TaxID=413964 RepID=A0AAW9SBZ9_9BACT
MKALSLLCSLFLILLSCNSSTSSEKLIGAWKLIGYQEFGIEKPYEEIWIDFNADGTCQLIEEGNRTKATWTLDEERFLLTIDGAKFSGNKPWYIQLDNRRFALKYKKEASYYFHEIERLPDDQTLARRKKEALIGTWEIEKVHLDNSDALSKQEMLKGRWIKLKSNGSFISGSGTQAINAGKWKFDDKTDSLAIHGNMNGGTRIRWKVKLAKPHYLYLSGSSQFQTTDVMLTCKRSDGK